MYLFTGYGTWLLGEVHIQQKLEMVSGQSFNNFFKYGVLVLRSCWKKGNCDITFNTAKNFIFSCSWSINHLVSKW